MTVNDLGGGAEEIFKMNSFFPGKPFRIKKFPRQYLSKFIYWAMLCMIQYRGFMEKSLQFFFLHFLRPHPQIINGRPLTAGTGGNNQQAW